MAEELNYTEYKRQIYLFYSEDGLADLAVGLMILGFGILLQLGQPALVGTLGILAYLTWMIGKNRLVIPRVGSIQPGPELSSRFLGFLTTLLLMGAGILAFFLINRSTGNSFSASHPLALLGLVVGLAISTLGLMLRAGRFYFYGCLVFLAMALGELLGATASIPDPFLLAVIAAGTLILIAGSVVLARFLKKYPVPEMEA